MLSLLGRNLLAVGNRLRCVLRGFHRVVFPVRILDRLGRERFTLFSDFHYMTSFGLITSVVARSTGTS